MADFLGIGHDRGTLDPGNCADFIAEQMELEKVWVDGEEI